MIATDLSEFIHNRRSIAPKFHIPGKAIERALIEQLLTDANWAPTHKLTEPWRFRVFHSTESRQKLSDYLVNFYQKNTPPEQFSAEKMQKSGENPLRAGAVIALVLHRNEASGLPEWEEVAAFAMAVQNMWLSGTAMGLGCQWVTPRAALEAREFLGLAPEERCLGLFYLGWHEAPELPGKRSTVQDKTVWM